MAGMHNMLLGLQAGTGGGGVVISTVDMVDPFGDGSGIALYRFNGDATDASGNYNGTATGVTYETGVFGQAGVFNASSINNRVNLSSKPINNTDTYSISAWLKITTAGFGGIYCQNSAGWVGHGIEFMLGSNYIEFSHVRSDAVAYNGDVGTSQKIDGNFHHYVGVRSGTSIKLYEDGILVASGSLTINTTANSQNGYIGQYQNNSNNTPQGVKQIDQLRLFTRALTEAEINILYTETKVA